MRMLLLSLALCVSSTTRAGAEDITVHVLEAKTRKPMKGIYLDLRTDCFNPKRPRAVQQITNGYGTGVFHGMSLDRQPICIDLFSVTHAYAPHQLDYVFTSPVQAERLKTADKLLNSIVTELPADVTFEVQKRSLGQRLQFMFQGN